MSKRPFRRRCCRRKASPANGIREAIPSVKIVTPRNSAAHDRASPTTTHAVRNAIGQTVAKLKGAQAHVSPALQTSGATPQPVLHGGTASAPVVSSVPARSNAPAVNVANLPSRSINGAAVIGRPSRHRASEARLERRTGSMVRQCGTSTKAKWR